MHSRNIWNLLGVAQDGEANRNEVCYVVVSQWGSATLHRSCFQIPHCLPLWLYQSYCLSPMFFYKINCFFVASPLQFIFFCTLFITSAFFLLIHSFTKLFSNPKNLIFPQHILSTSFTKLDHLLPYANPIQSSTLLNLIHLLKHFRILLPISYA